MEMKWKSYYSIAVVLIYAILITLFFYLERSPYQSVESKQEKFQNCSYFKPCISFCEESAELYTDDDLITNFPYQDFVKSIDTKTYKAVRNSLSCTKFEKRTVISDEKKFEIDYDGDAKYNDDYFKNYKYCLQPYDKTTKFKIRLEICMADHFFMTKIHYIALFITIALLLIPLLIYAIISDIRESLNGKLCIALLASQIVTILIIPFVDIEHYHSPVIFFLSYIGAFSANVCINFMCYNIYLTFKHFCQPIDQIEYFKKYLISLASIGLLLILVVTVSIWEMPSLPLFLVTLYVLSIFMLFLIIFLDIYTLVSCFYYIAKLRNSNAVSDSTRLDIERERFWLYMKLFGIITTTWIVEMMAFAMPQSYESQFVADVVKCYSAAMIAFLLLWNENIQKLVFQKYSTMRSDSDVENCVENDGSSSVAY